MQVHGNNLILSCRGVLFAFHLRIISWVVSSCGMPQVLIGKWCIVLHTVCR